MVIERIASETVSGLFPRLSSTWKTTTARIPEEFGLGQEAFLLASLVVPAVHGLVSAFAAKFFEGAEAHSALRILT
jgi:hypothetical protein